MVDHEAVGVNVEYDFILDQSPDSKFGVATAHPACRVFAVGRGFERIWNAWNFVQNYIWKFGQLDQSDLRQMRSVQHHQLHRHALLYFQLSAILFVFF